MISKSSSFESRFSPSSPEAPRTTTIVNKNIQLLDMIETIRQAS